MSMSSSLATIHVLLHAHPHSRTLALKCRTTLESQLSWIRRGRSFDSEAGSIHIDFTFHYWNEFCVPLSSALSALYFRLKPGCASSISLAKNYMSKLLVI